MGLVDHRRRILRPFLFLAEIHSGPTAHIILDFSHIDSDRSVADCKRELELGFLPQEGSTVEFYALCSLSSVGIDSRGSSASYSQPTLRLVWPLPRVSRICNMVGLPRLASQPSGNHKILTRSAKKLAERRCHYQPITAILYITRMGMVANAIHAESV